MIRIMAVCFVLVAIGCQKYDVAARPPLQQPFAGETGKRTVLAYFSAVRAGCPVAQIEADLGLSPSTNRCAPTFQPYNPLWQVMYWQYGLLIAFDAKDVSAKGDGSQLVYAGNPSAMTIEEYKQELRKIGVP